VTHVLTAILWLSFAAGVFAIVAFLLRRPD